MGRKVFFLGSTIIYGAITTTELYSYLVLIFVYFNFLNLILPIGIGSGFVRYFYEAEDRLLFFKFISFCLLIITVLLSVIGIFSFKFFSEPINTFSIVSFIFLLSILSIFSEHYLTYLRFNEKMRLFDRFNGIMLAVSLINILFFYVVDKIDLFEINIVYLMVSYLLYYLIPTLYFFRKEFMFFSINDFKTYLTNNLGLIKSVFYFSICILPANLCYFITDASDKLIINKYLSLEQVAIYGLLYQISFFLSFIFNQIARVMFVPYIFKNYKEPQIQLYLNKVSHILLFGIVISFFIIYFLLLIFIPYFFPEYAIGIALFNELYIGASCIIFSSLFLSNIHLAQKSYLSTIVELISAFINFYLNFLLIPIYGILGAAISTLLALSLRSLLHIIIGYNIFNLRFPIYRLSITSPKK